MRTFVVSIITCLMMSLASAAHGEALKILYEDRPPYYVTDDDGSVGGVVSARVDQALRKAAIAAVWLHRPSKRQIAAVKRGVDKVCTPGWFKNPERAAFAKFSAPVYRDRPQVIVFRADNAGRINHATLAALIADQNFILGAKDGYSYGDFVDGLIAARSPQMVRTTQNIGGMVQMLLARRFDYFIAAPEEFAVLSGAMGEAGGEIMSAELPDFPAGNRRYLMCSRKVADETIRRFNAALSELPAQ